MADSSTISTVAYIYKHRYSDRQATEIALRDHPTFYAIPKEGAFDGTDFNYAITTGNPQGISSVFGTAQGAAAPLKGAQLAAIPYTKYGDLTIDGPSMLRARGGKGSFYDLITRSQDGILDELGANIAYDLFRDQSGQRGQRATGGLTGNVVTLTFYRDVEHFKRGMQVIASQNSNGTSARSGFATVVGLNRTNGTITLDNAATLVGFADSDYLFRNGDPGNCIEGMELCTPLSVPVAGDSFRGIDRSVDAEALSGVRINDTSRYPEELIGDIAVEMQIIAKKAVDCQVFPSTFQAMVKRLGAKVEYMGSDIGGTADVGFEFIILHTAGGALKVMSDPDARYDRVRLNRPDAHCIKHLEELVHIIRDDGRPMLRDANTDGLEIRARFIGNYIQYDTGSNGVGAVTAI